MGARSTNSKQSFFDDFFRSGTDAVNPVPIPEGLTATGGTISDYTDSGTAYRAHVFTSSGTFVVSDLGNISSNIDYLAIAGGGGAGFSHPGAGGGGGGAGGVVGSDSNIPSTYRASALSVSAQTYTITVGGGGGGASYVSPGASNPGQTGNSGANSVISGPDISTITATGGGRGGNAFSPRAGDASGS